MKQDNSAPYIDAMNGAQITPYHRWEMAQLRPLIDSSDYFETRTLLRKWRAASCAICLFDWGLWSGLLHPMLCGSSPVPLLSMADDFGLRLMNLKCRNAARIFHFFQKELCWRHHRLSLRHIKSWICRKTISVSARLRKKRRQVAAKPLRNGQWETTAEPQASAGILQESSKNPPRILRAYDLKPEYKVSKVETCNISIFSPSGRCNEPIRPINFSCVSLSLDYFRLADSSPINYLDRVAQSYYY